MIKSLTDCAQCSHKSVCQYKDNAKHDADNLASRRYDEECHTIINWADASDVRHVDITFSCKDFNAIQGVHW